MKFNAAAKHILVRIGKVSPVILMKITGSDFCNLNLRFHPSIKIWSLPQLRVLILGTTVSVNSFCRTLGRTRYNLLEARSIGWEGAPAEQSARFLEELVF
jgi:hypothetical protein